MPSANQKRMIKHIHETVFILYMIIILMKSRFKKYVILQKSTAVRSIDTSKINMNYSTLYLTLLHNKL